VLLLTAVSAWVLNTYVLTHTPYLRTVAFIVVIASGVQITEMAVKKYFPVLFRQLGIYLPLITTNCAILGLALFQTVYPGWYQGRTVHIHVKVHVGGNVIHTGQLYFPDSFTDAVYKKSPYTKRPSRDTRNSNDFVYANGGKNSLLSVRADGSGGYVASITMGVVRA